MRIREARHKHPPWEEERRGGDNSPKTSKTLPSPYGRLSKTDDAIVETFDPYLTFNSVCSFNDRLLVDISPSVRWIT